MCDVSEEREREKERGFAQSKLVMILNISDIGLG